MKLLCLNSLTHDLPPAQWDQSLAEDKSLTVAALAERKHVSNGINIVGDWFARKAGFFRPLVTLNGVLNSISDYGLKFGACH